MRLVSVVLCVAVAFTAFAQTPSKIKRDACVKACETETDQDKKKKCELACGFTDERRVFKGSVYVGEVIDTFAADEVLKYLNPEDANKSKMRVVGGADFEYRLFNSSTLGNQLWVYGETIHGMRSRDVDCKVENNKKLPVCRDNITDPTTTPGANEFIAILRGASSLEAFVGLRYEFPPPLQDLSDSPARLYINGQLGFLTVAGGGGDVLDDHHIGVGAKAVGGRFDGSFLEIGFGRNDVFLRKHDQRFVIDGMLSIDPNSTAGVLGRLQGLRPFIEFTGSFDGGGGADSIQTWFGLDYEFLP